VPVASGYTITATYGAGNVTSSSQSVTSGNTTAVPLTIATGTVTVTTKNQTPANLSGVSLTLNGPNSFSATGSSSAGTYSFLNVPSGSGYTVSYAYGAATGTSASQTAPTTVALTINTGSLNGTVTINGTTLSNLTVTLTGSNGFSATATTSGSGVAAFTLVPAGSGYAIAVTYGAATATTSSISVASGGTATPSLPVPFGSITVQTETNACAISKNINVAITALNSYNPGTHSSGNAASYTFTNVPAGSGYQVTGTGMTSKTASVTSGSTTTVILSPNGSC
jgi:hypothetical protein